MLWAYSTHLLQMVNLDTRANVIFAVEVALRTGVLGSLSRLQIAMQLLQMARLVKRPQADYLAACFTLRQA